MTKDEALRLALEALEGIYIEPEHLDYIADWWPACREAITAIKAALEAKDEPVATKNNDGVTLHLGWDDLPVGTKLYATPPQRTWVGLTDEDRFELAKAQYGWEDLLFAAEAKLRSKNESKN